MITIQGIYPPIPTFFDENEDLDLATLREHLTRLKAAGITGFVALGSNGEAVHLDRDERRVVIATTREMAGPEGQVLAGAGTDSTRGTNALCQLAAEAGADVALVLPPHYYRGQMNATAIRAHYLAVADASPIPVMIYNMPANAAGLDLDAETVITLSAHPNIIGMKDSSGNVAKLAEVVAGARADFATLAGSAGFLLPALVVGARGAIAALANIAPRECLELVALYESGKMDEARTLQARLIPVNTAVTSGYGVPGLKAALEFVAHYGAAPRRPLAPLGQSERVKLRSLLAEADLLRGMRPVPV
ncbi:MAG TPA: dihydrodipicolinate synthase family protein [Ktedonobacterales bacterium]|jgi:dihydrodipicolinate synthase/N-acetylneuraminate lyase|nr:dihydrodipicolinate synthase family protein [Ktedonobacterales bacterium]